MQELNKYTAGAKDGKHDKNYKEGKEVGKEVAEDGGKDGNDGMGGKEERGERGQRRVLVTKDRLLAAASGYVGVSVALRAVSE